MYSKEVHCVIATPAYYFRERQGSICGPPHASKHILFQWHTLLPTTASARLSSYGSRNSLSVIGSGMTGFALNVYLAKVLYPAPEQKPELALAFTVLNLGFTIPFVFGGPLAGAWADRHDRKQSMIVTNTAN